MEEKRKKENKRRNVVVCSDVCRLISLKLCMIIIYIKFNSFFYVIVSVLDVILDHCD